MRRWRHAAGLAFLALAGVWAATTLGNHGNQLWSGQWDFMHVQADGFTPTGVSGGFALRHETDVDGPILLTQIGGTPCPEPTDYFAGGYTVPDDEALPPGESFVDTGKIRGCTVGSDPEHLVGRYESNASGGDRGDFDLRLNDDGLGWTGTFTVDPGSATSKWWGTFESHFDDGAEDLPNPPYPAGTDGETGGQPPETEPPGPLPPETQRVPAGGVDWPNAA